MYIMVMHITKMYTTVMYITTLYITVEMSYTLQTPVYFHHCVLYVIEDNVSQNKKQIVREVLNNKKTFGWI